MTKVKRTDFNPYGWDLFKMDNKRFTQTLTAWIDEQMNVNKKEESKEDAIKNLKNIFNMG